MIENKAAEGLKPNKKLDKYTDLIQHYSCPVCGEYFGKAGVHNVILFNKPGHCPDCGQKNRLERR